MPVGVAVSRRGGEICDGGDPLTPPASRWKVQREEVMGCIRGYYKAALDRLPPSLIPRVLDAGVCFGFLDPVSNIIANTVSYEPLPGEEEEADQEEEEQGRRRGEKRKRSQPDTGSIAARSLEGLITFLTIYFRYLRTREALRYLLVSKADLFQAVHLIHRDLTTVGLAVDHPTTKVALTCAAYSAKHPHPEVFVSCSISLASHMDDVYCCLWRRPRRLRPSTMTTLFEISRQGGSSQGKVKPLDDAATRSYNLSQRLPAYSNIGGELHLEKVLLDRIHGFYLEAISRIPTTLLRSRLHRALLKAGHCYGPFGPVANILLNTIWYDTTFPMQEEFEVDMIRTESLALVESHSLRGILAFMCVLCPGLSTHDALKELLRDNARIDKVRKINGGDLSMPSPVSAAYKAASAAAYFPNPTELANFAEKLLPAVEETLKPLLEAKRTLSPDDIQTISASLSKHRPPTKPLGQVQKLIPQACKMVSASRKKFAAHQRLIRKRVEAALQKHAQMQGDEYELHAICGANGKICEDGKYGYLFNRNGCPFSHINVLVRQKGVADPMLLFIECRNDLKDVEDVPVLCRVSESLEDAGRCFHCEDAGIKIVHPSFGSYRGQSRDFLDMARGVRLVSTDGLIQSEEMSTVFVDVVQIADFFYFDPLWDADSAKFINWYLGKGQHVRSNISTAFYGCEERD
ncbi:hypothetical protein ACP70R_025717 [Stipagrostis hirtigluma subsp. patula]